MLKAVLDPEDQDLADAFVELINEVVLRRLTPEGSQSIRISDLDEVSMLAQRIDRITQGWKMEGQRDEAAHIFLDLFATKHGDVPARVRKRVASAGKEQLETWLRRLLRTDSPEDVFKD